MPASGKINAVAMMNRGRLSLHKDMFSACLKLSLMCTGKDASVTSEAKTSIRPENALKIVGDNAVASMKATVAAMKKNCTKVPLVQYAVVTYASGSDLTCVSFWLSFVDVFV